MLFDGHAIKLKNLDGGLVELHFDLQNESVNKFGNLTITELAQVLDILESKSSEIKGLLLTSGKSVFFVGADINEFVPLFSKGPEAIAEGIGRNVTNFNRLEDLPFPTVVAINGYAVGGGLEVCLACDFRLMSETAKVGLPETKLGIIPGWGGTVRLSRLAGVDVAVEWIASGKEYAASDALKSGVVDGVVEADSLRDAAMRVLHRAVAGELDIETRRSKKKGPLGHNDIEGLLAFESSKAFVGAKAGRNYPAPVAAIKSMQNGAKLCREDALAIETKTFVKMSQTPAAASLVSIFLNDQLLSKRAKTWAAQSEGALERAAVLGAGIMGGGIAYQSAYKKIPIKMKDIAQAGLDLGLKEAASILSKRVERGRMTHQDMAKTLNLIEPTLGYDGFSEVDLVVEAVVENSNVKKSVLAEAEGKIRSDTVLCSNTSTISISDLATALSRPENFCGMHFFNPVHKMPLVEVIRGEKTSEAAIAKTVKYANKLGKKAVVVNDCPGFLVNRVLFPYFSGFSLLVRDGADIQQIDKVMERWGWPMGPAYLMDVVGLDTGVHAEAVMADGFPDRMSRNFKSVTDILFENKLLGQKSGQGFYVYKHDKKGKLKKTFDASVMDLFKPHIEQPREFSDEEIIARMMIPMATELSRCLEEGIVETPSEADMALVYGLGFPPFRGGVFRWIDDMGLDRFVEMTGRYQSLGEIYHPTAGMLARAGENTPFYDLSK